MVCGVGATPQAVATVPTSVMVDTFKKSRRLIFLLSIAISFCLCYGMKQTHIWQQQPDTFCLILLYHRLCPTTFTFRTKFWIFRTHLAWAVQMASLEDWTWRRVQIQDVRQTLHIEFPIDGLEIPIPRMDSHSDRSLRAAARDHSVGRDPANQTIMPRRAKY